MALRLEGTVAAGFVCDSTDCSLNAIWAVIVATPYLGEPSRPPILTFTHIHTCAHHWHIVRRELVTDHMREAIRRIADQHDGKADIEHQWLMRVGVYEPDYHRFLETAGLIAPGDQVIVSGAPPLDLG